MLSIYKSNDNNFFNFFTIFLLFLKFTLNSITITQLDNPIENINIFHNYTFLFDYTNLKNLSNLSYIQQEFEISRKTISSLIYLNDLVPYKNITSHDIIICAVKLRFKNLTFELPKTNNFDALIYIKEGKRYKFHSCNIKGKKKIITVFEIKENYKDYKFKFRYKILKELMSFLGFNKNDLKKNKIKNNFIRFPYYLSSAMNAKKTYDKIFKLYNLRPKKKAYTLYKLQKVGYISGWSNNYPINDIKSDYLRSTTCITELTLNLLKDLPNQYHINHCELLYYINKCYLINQKCIKKTDFENNYLLEYNFDKNNNLICYLNNKKNIKARQCGKIYGKIINYKEILKSFTPQKINLKNSGPKSKLAPEVFKYDYQTLFLLHPNKKYCTKQHPRTLFFFNYEISDPINYIKNSPKLQNYKIDVVNITDKNFFMTLYRDYIRGEKLKVFKKKMIFTISSKASANYISSDGIYIPKLKYQRKLYFPGDASFKKNLYKFYKMFQKLFPDDYDFMLETYLYPDEKDIIKQKFENYTFSPNNTWIIKPDKGYGGNMKFFKDYIKNINNTKISQFILSKYLEKPFLINGNKIDVRYNIIVTGLTPLRIYFAKEGFVKISTKKYELNKKSINDLSMHITNVHYNEHVKGYRKAENESDYGSFLWTHNMLKNYLTSKGYNYTAMEEKIINTILLSFFSVQDDYVQKIKKFGVKSNNFINLFGFDIIFDENFTKPYILEMNRGSPSFDFCLYINKKIYRDVLPSAYNLFGFVPYNHSDIKGKSMDEEYDYKNNTLEEDVDEALCEFGRPRGEFIKIFPNLNNIDKYKKYIINKDKVEQNEILWEKMKELNIE